METQQKCSVENCNKPANKKKLCYAHYRRLQLYGTPLGGSTSWGQPEAFIQNVALPSRSNECLLWPYAKTPAGYPRIKNKLVTRVICELIYGASDGSYALHSCGNGHIGCVNPKHLRWGNQSQNSEDARVHGVLPIGSSNGQAKLTEESVRYIKSLKGLVSQSELARQFGVSNVTIHDIHAGKTWAWL